MSYYEPVYPTMPFGKHKGTMVDRLPESYLRWMAKSMSDPFLRVCAAAALAGKECPEPEDCIFLDAADSGAIILIDAPYELKEDIKMLSERGWDAERKKWWVPIHGFNELMDEFPAAHPSAILKTLVSRNDEQKDILAAINADAGTGKSIDVGDGLQLYPYQATAIRFLDAVEGKGLITDEMGCVAGDAMISLNRAGKSFKMRLEQFHQRFNSDGTRWHDWDKSIPTMARSLMPDGTFQLNQVLKVIDKSRQTVLKITTLSGKKLKLTPDHEIKRPYGWTPAANLVVGNLVLCDLRGKAIADVIVDIEVVAPQQVYDIVMDDPGRNFIANGIVVHNCGKTVEALAWLRAHPANRPVLVVCPATMKGTWVKEIAKWLNVTDPIVLKSKDTYAFDPTRGVVVINYDIMDAWKESLLHHRYNTMIVDESHYCFPYDTLIHTDQGDLPIGEIVDSKTNVKVPCCDLDTNQIEWRCITHYFKHPKPISMIKINHTYGEIICTPGHRIQTNEGYIPAEDIQSGTYLRKMWETVHGDEKRESHNEVLQQTMRSTEPIRRSGRTRTNEQGIKETDGTEDMRVLRKVIRNSIKRKNIGKQEVLQQILQCSVSIIAAWRRRILPKSSGKSSTSPFRKEATRHIKTNEGKQSNARSGNSTKSIQNITGDASYAERTRRKWQTFASSPTEATRCIVDRMVSRICSFVGGTSGRLSNELQDRHSESTTDDSNRSRWEFPPQSKRTGHKEGYKVIQSRVDSIEILESTDTGRSGCGNERDQFVYNIEVKPHHNYFANGILVANCKNPTAKRSKAVVAIAHRCKHRILLTGTPVINRPIELFNQLHAVDPITWSSFFNFGKKYCGAHQEYISNEKQVWMFDGATNIDELSERLKSTIMLRRTKAQVLPDLPDKSRQVIDIEIDNRKAYTKLVDGMTDSYLGAPIVGFTELLMMMMRGKIKPSIRYIDDVLQDVDKLVVFCTHKEMINALEEKFLDRGVVKIDGSVAVHKRTDLIDQFQTDPETHLFLGNVQAAGIGITLTAASHAVFTELPWSPMDLEQAEDRLHRISQENAVNIYVLNAINTVDAHITDLIVHKKQIINNINKDMTMDDLREFTQK